MSGCPNRVSSTIRICSHPLTAALSEAKKAYDNVSDRLAGARTQHEQELRNLRSLRVGAGSAATTVAVQQITHVARHLIRYLGSADSQRDRPLAPARATIGCGESG